MQTWTEFQLMMTRLRRFAIVLACVSVSCRASYPTAPNPTALAVQVLYGKSMSYAVIGSSYSFNAYAVRSDGAWEDVTGACTWVSSDSQVLTPQATAGSFTAVGAGRAEIRASYQSKAGVLSVPVVRTDLLAYPRLSISVAYLYRDPMKMGEAAGLFVYLLMSRDSAQDVTNLVTWTSSNPAVVNVVAGSRPAQVYSVGPGSAVISAAYNGLTVEYGISVIPVW